MSLVDDLVVIMRRFTVRKLSGGTYRGSRSPSQYAVFVDGKKATAGATHIETALARDEMVAREILCALGVDQ
jgi:hypothetical protein